MAPFKETSARDYTPAEQGNRAGMGELFAPAPQPKTELGRYRILSPNAGARVSPLCLGAMSIGDQWNGFMGSGLGPDKAEEFLDVFYESGGNFLDTANNYQDEQSEMIIGEWMEKRGIRDQIVLATKYTTFYPNRKEGRFEGIAANYQGNHKKSLRHSVEASLRKLRTDYIDLLYLHWWDYSTSIPEVMQSLNELVKSGKVLYLGVSDTPAWIVSQANEYARHHGMTPFSVYQGSWNVSSRDIEREVIPMCRANGMSLAPWNVLGGGLFKTPEELKARAGTLRGGAKELPEAQLKMAGVLEEVAKEVGEGIKLPHIALAWVRQSFADIFPIIGGTSIDNLKTNIKALDIHLTPEQMKKLNDASAFDPGFPAAFFGQDPHYLPGGVPNSGLVNATAHLKFTEYP